jgi:hypothetical protein
VPVWQWSNHGEGKKEVGVGVVQGRCKEFEVTCESKAFGHADREKVEADSGSGLAKGDEAEGATAVGSQEGGLGTRPKKGALEGPEVQRVARIAVLVDAVVGRYNDESTVGGEDLESGERRRRGA